MNIFKRILTALMFASLLPVMAASASAAAPQECVSNKECAASEYCNATPQCPGDKIKGECAKRPDFCTEDYRPVTGCNGKEYSNRCHAAADGQSSGPVNK